VAVRIRMKKMGRAHAPFYRVCAVDARKPRDGRVIEELGYYDPMVPETDARAVLKGDRIDYWVSVGAQPTDKVAILIKKYGSSGTHLEAQKAAVERLGRRKQYVPAPTPPRPAPAPPSEQAPELSGGQANVDSTNEPSAEAQPQAVTE
jgi:small subunit ribosomal protein S16